MNMTVGQKEMNARKLVAILFAGEAAYEQKIRLMRGYLSKLAEERENAQAKEKGSRVKPADHAEKLSQNAGSLAFPSIDDLFMYTFADQLSSVIFQAQDNLLKAVAAYVKAGKIREGSALVIQKAVREALNPQNMLSQVQAFVARAQSEAEFQRQSGSYSSVTPFPSLHEEFRSRAQELHQLTQSSTNSLEQQVQLLLQNLLFTRYAGEVTAAIRDKSPQKSNALLEDSLFFVKSDAFQEASDRASHVFWTQLSPSYSSTFWQQASGLPLPRLGDSCRGEADSTWRHGRR